jgi:phosphoglycerol transferase
MTVPSTRAPDLGSDTAPGGAEAAAPGHDDAVGRPRAGRAWLLQVRDGAIVATATGAVTAVLFRIWAIPLRVPFVYDHDAIAQLAETKSILDNGWYQHNPRVGFPVGLDHRDFPIETDNLHWLGIKALGLFSHDAALVTNAYYLLSFVLVALTAFFVTRALGVSRRFSFVVALLYTFLPYHFLRSTSHLTLAAYFSVPIACLLTIRVWDHVPPLFTDDGGRVRFRVRMTGALLLVAAAAVIASSDSYYAVFCIALLCIAGVLQLLVSREWRSLVAGVSISLLIGVGMLANLAPSLLYWQAHGRNAQVAHRTVQESDFYALRPIQMLSPVPGYRIPFIGDITTTVLKAPNNSETTQFLGLVASIGFLGLLVVLLGLGGRRSRDRSPPLVFRLASLTGVAVLLGVTGGLSWVLGLAGFTDIRAWNRISVFIAFYALVAVGLTLDKLVARIPDAAWKPYATAGIAIALVTVGVLDQTSSAIIPDSRRNSAQWNSDAAFVARIEGTVGPGGAVFQLPYLPFPEAELSLPPYGIKDYDPYRGYLHSQGLSWSYGGMRGRASDWQRQVVRLPRAQMLDAIVAVGFDGLWLDTRGYANGGAALAEQLTSVVGSQPIRSPDGRFLFFDLRDYASGVRARLGAAAMEALRTRTLRDLG